MPSKHDVIVIGGGVTGCAIAYELAKRSVKVLLLDTSLAGKATSASAGGLWPIGESVGLGCGIILHASLAKPNAAGEAVDEGPEVLPAVFRDFLVASNLRFPALANELRELSGIDIEYEERNGLLFLIYSEPEAAFVDRLASTLPDQSVFEMLTPSQVQRLEPGISEDILGGVLFPGEHQVNPMLLAEAFKRAAIQLGASFRPGTHVSELRLSANRVVGVLVEGELLQCHTVVNAAGAWAAKLGSTIGVDLPVVPVRGQVVLTETLPQTLGVCVSTSRTYLLQKSHGEILIGSTTEYVDFDPSVTPNAIQDLCRGAINCLPMLRDVNIARVWAGFRPGTPDELPILGCVEGVEGYVNATGGFRTGIVAAPITGELIAQLIREEQLSYPIDAFLLSRFESTSAAGSAMP